MTTPEFNRASPQRVRRARALRLAGDSLKSEQGQARPSNRTGTALASASVVRVFLKSSPSKFQRYLHDSRRRAIGAGKQLVHHPARDAKSKKARISKRT